MIFARWLLAVFFVAAGLNHFRDPAFYVAMIPRMLPAPEALNVIAGAAEVLGGVGVLFPRLRRAAGFGLIALLLAVFPANVYAALEGKLAGLAAPPAALWARLPFQAFFVFWVWWVAIRKADAEPAPKPS
jgi:uncharacterized membrane protein